MSSNNNGVHLLVFPFPAQGHMLPLLDLTHQLSLRGLSTTILITPKNLPILSPLLSANPSIQTLVLPFPDHPSIPPGVENVKELGNHGTIPMIHALSRLQEPIIQWYKSHGNSPVAILSDFFLGWTHHLACQLSIPRIVFYNTGAFSVAVLDHLWANSESVKRGSSHEMITFEDLPGRPAFDWAQLPSIFRRYRESQFDETTSQFVKASMVANGLSWASVYNTFEALEGEFLERSRERTGPTRLYIVGPLIMLGGPNRVGGGSGDDGGVLSWLDQCDDESVLYVCFGSQKVLKREQMEALAIGLERSGVRFVWAVKPPTDQQAVGDGYGLVPEGFEDRVTGRGYIVSGWVPQVSILGHRAVYGFLSHCGWNSILEAISVGVMMLCWPMEADQFVNARLLVQYKGAAIQVCDGGDTVPDSTEFARKITESMHRNALERVRTKELRDEALGATSVGGSSIGDLDGFVQALTQLEVDKV